MTLAIERSWSCSVSEQSSTESSTGDVIGERPQVVGRARGSGGSADAPESEDRRALHVRPHAEAVDHFDLDARGGDAGHGVEEDVVDVARDESGLSRAP
jgi:hypothetical protein